MHPFKKILQATLPFRQAYAEWESIHYGLLNSVEKEYRQKLQDSEYFDPRFYRMQVRHSLVARIMPFRHFILRGEQMDIAPGPNFVARAYYQKNPDVSKRGMLALRHYLTSGQEEGRQIRPNIAFTDHAPSQSPHERELVTYAHIGAGKCGSSAIQTCLSQQPVLRRKDGGTLEYRVISATGILRSSGVQRSLRCMATGYCPSLTAASTAKIPRKVFAKAVESVKNDPVPVVFSCEGWLQEMSSRPEYRSLMMEMFSGGGARKVKLIAFVRPLVKWINSAWWQWGAWTPGVKFDDWLEVALNVNWNSVSRRLIQSLGSDVLTVRPVLGNVVDQMFDEIGCLKTENQNDSSNKSLPASVLNLYHQALDLRPGAHITKSDFVVSRVLSVSTHRYSSTPWVLGPKRIEQILKRTKDSNLKLLELMSPSDREAVLADPSWWSADAYQGLQRVDADIAPRAAPGDMTALSVDLFRGLNASVGVLAERGLLPELDLALKTVFPNERNTKPAKRV